MSFLGSWLPGVLNFVVKEAPHLQEDVQTADKLGKELFAIVNGLRDSRSKLLALGKIEEFSQHLFNAFQAHAQATHQSAAKPAAKPAAKK